MAKDKFDKDTIDILSGCKAVGRPRKYMTSADRKKAYYKRSKKAGATRLSAIVPAQLCDKWLDADCTPETKKNSCLVIVHSGECSKKNSFQGLEMKEASFRNGKWYDKYTMKEISVTAWTNEKLPLPFNMIAAGFGVAKSLLSNENIA